MCHHHTLWTTSLECSCGVRGRAVWPRCGQHTTSVSRHVRLPGRCGARLQWCGAAASCLAQDEWHLACSSENTEPSAHCTSCCVRQAAPQRGFAPTFVQPPGLWTCTRRVSEGFGLTLEPHPAQVPRTSPAGPAMAACEDRPPPLCAASTSGVSCQMCAKCSTHAESSQHEALSSLRMLGLHAAEVKLWLAEKAMLGSSIVHMQVAHYTPLQRLAEATRLQGGSAA